MIVRFYMFGDDHRTADVKVFKEDTFRQTIFVWYLAGIEEAFPAVIEMLQAMRINEEVVSVDALLQIWHWLYSIALKHKVKDQPLLRPTTS